MSYTFSDQQNKLSSLLGDPNSSTDDQWPLATRKKEINRGELRFAVDTKMLRNYASGTLSSLTIDFPSDMIEVFVLYILSSSTVKYKITNDREISVKDLERYAGYGGDIPWYYTWEFSGTRKIKFLGSSGNNGRTYELFYIKKPTTELSSDSDESLFPEELREAPVHYAASQLLEQIGKTDLAQYHMNKYLEYVQMGRKLVIDRDLDYDLPRPDFNMGDTQVQDTQGGGFPV